jgi:hypothetical protein
MTALGVAEARRTISAPFCAAVVEMVGAEVTFNPPPRFPPLSTLPPPHPRTTAPAKKTAANIATFDRIAPP